MVEVERLGDSEPKRPRLQPITEERHRVPLSAERAPPAQPRIPFGMEPGGHGLRRGAIPDRKRVWREIERCQKMRVAQVGNFGPGHQAGDPDESLRVAGVSEIGRCDAVASKTRQPFANGVLRGFREVDDPGGGIREVEPAEPLRRGNESRRERLILGGFRVPGETAPDGKCTRIAGRCRNGHAKTPA